jgi:hypothetical protein
LDVAIVGRRVQHFNAQFVAENAGISEEWLSARESVQVGAADTDAMDAHQRLIVANLGSRNIAAAELARMFKRDLLHGMGCSETKTGELREFS